MKNTKREGQGLTEQIVEMADVLEHKLMSGSRAIINEELVEAEGALARLYDYLILAKRRIKESRRALA